jgi:quinol monooxygenase YgiN
VIVLIARMHVVEGKEKEFEKAYHKAAPKVLKDPGAVAYILHRQTEDPTKFCFYEKYENDEAVKFHTTTAHFKEFFKTITPLLKEQPELIFYTEV